MWIFKKKEPGNPERDPKETEFFKLTSYAEASIREFVQNSLDARKNSGTILRIKIGKLYVEKKEARYFLGDNLLTHLKSSINFDKDYPDIIPCLVLEDYSTTGLDGNTDPCAGKGNFYNFWWREGISEKTSGKAGRWGLGKTTFHMVSKIRTFFGFTVRNDGKKLLMGKALLKTHEISGEKYEYFGYFCNEDWTPIEDADVISNFKKYFQVDRETDTGLSVVIPMPLDEIDRDAVSRAVIQHYYYPILAGSLKVELNWDGEYEIYDKGNLIEKASNINWGGTSWEGLDLKKILEFIKDSLEIPAINLKVLDEDDPEITEKSFDGQLSVVKEIFLKGENLKFCVPVNIKKENSDIEQTTCFSILLKSFPQLKEPFQGYIRSGILIAEMRPLKNHKVAALFIAEDQAICEFLGDSETPAHTDWKERTEGFAEKYRNAKRILRFIKNSLPRIVSILDEAPFEKTKEFWKNAFSLPADKDNDGNGGHKKNFKIVLGKVDDKYMKDGFKYLKLISENGNLWSIRVFQNTKIRDNEGNEGDYEKIQSGQLLKVFGKMGGDFELDADEIIIEPVDNYFFIEGVEGGFKLKNNPEKPLEITRKIRIYVAYDVRRGLAFKKYSPLDFDFDKVGNIEVTARGCEILRRERNLIEVKTVEPFFSLEAKGFDKNRDLIIDVKV